MERQSTIHSTFVIERSYPTTPDRVFAALSDPEKTRRWFATSETHDVERFEMDFRVGGRELACYRFNANSPFPGVSLVDKTGYLDIVPDRRVVTASTMALGDRHISASLNTFELLATATGTDLIFTHQGAFFEGSDGPERREGGWRKLFDRLAEELAR